MVSHRHLEYVSALAKSGSFKRAALDLYISQPALSKGISALEEELGCLLFDRASRPLKLTPAGEVVFEEAKRSLISQERMSRKLLKLQGRSDGVLRIAFGSLSGKLYPVRFTKLFQQKYPEMELEFHLRSWDEAFTLLKNNDVDLAVADSTLVPLDDYDVISIPNCPVGVFCAPDHPLAQEEQPLDLSRVFQEKMVICGAPPWAREWLRVHMPEYDFRDSPAKVKVDCYRIIRELLFDGTWCSVLPEYSFYEELVSGELVLLKLKETPDSRSGILFPKKGPLTAEITCAIKILKEMTFPDPALASKAE